MDRALRLEETQWIHSGAIVVRLNLQFCSDFFAAHVAFATREVCALTKSSNMQKYSHF